MEELRWGKGNLWLTVLWQVSGTTGDGTQTCRLHDGAPSSTTHSRSQPWTWEPEPLKTSPNPHSLNKHHLGPLCARGREVLRTRSDTWTQEATATARGCPRNKGQRGEPTTAWHPNSNVRVSKKCLHHRTFALTWWLLPNYLPILCLSFLIYKMGRQSHLHLLDCHQD